MTHWTVSRPKLELQLD